MALDLQQSDKKFDTDKDNNAKSAVTNLNPPKDSKSLDPSKMLDLLKPTLALLNPPKDESTKNYELGKPAITYLESNKGGLNKKYDDPVKDSKSQQKP